MNKSFYQYTDYDIFSLEINSEMENFDRGLDVMEFKHVNMSFHFSPIENPWTS